MSVKSGKEKILDILGKPIEEMSMAELEALEVSLKERMAEKNAARRKEALAALEETARAHGYKLMELIGPAPRKPRKAPRGPLLVHPTDSSLTWTGRGRRPQWVKDFVDAGGSIDDLKP